MLKRRSKHGPSGLDIGASSIKMLQLSDVGRQPSILAAEHREIPGGGAERSDFILAVISEALRYKPFVGRDVVLSLGSGEFQMKNIRLPRMPASELASAVAFEAQERFGFGSDAAQIRHIPVGEVRHGEELKEEVERLLRTSHFKVGVEHVRKDITGYVQALPRRSDPAVRQVVEEIEACIREFLIISELEIRFGEQLLGIDEPWFSWECNRA